MLDNYCVLPVYFFKEEIIELMQNIRISQFKLAMHEFFLPVCICIGVTTSIVNAHCITFLKVTTHAQLLTHEEITLLSTELDMSISQFDLHEFSTELDFSSRIR